ncbi:MAG TPA: HAMP domain-containing sensor histidine kinase [Solirubrobacteraceae bacterium]|nr:HAMP domain-containing sensor histidine kinase [Solirubrobacteraceae bacterium]
MSALLTFVILFSFALVVGALTIHRIRSDFYGEVERAGTRLPGELRFQIVTNSSGEKSLQISPSLQTVATDQSAVVKVFGVSGQLEQAPARAPSLGEPNIKEPVTAHGYLVVSHAVSLYRNGIPEGELILQYARPLSAIDSTIARVELLLVLGVLAGSGLALLAGAVIARRAMYPIAQLTSTAAEIARTRDPSLTLPQPQAEDEVGELAHTLQGMLHELDSAHTETEAMLDRQRRFVADASHELRTPLTSVLANLELLAESLRGEEADAARSALRSSQRMRRLVADLLLLARADVGRVVKRERVDLAQVAIEAAAELGPMSATHEISLDVKPASVQAARDEIMRVAINLIENAVRHTPPGTEIRVLTRSPGAGRAQLVVEDDGPGVPARLRGSLFERFVRGAGDRGGSFGLGLAIVKAVAESHGGSVRVEEVHADREPRGARFVVELPSASDLHDDRKDHRPSAQSVVDQLG